MDQDNLRPVEKEVLEDGRRDGEEKQADGVADSTSYVRSGRTSGICG